MTVSKQLEADTEVELAEDTEVEEANHLAVATEVAAAEEVEAAPSVTIMEPSPSHPIRTGELNAESCSRTQPSTEIASTRHQLD